MKHATQTAAVTALTAMAFAIATGAASAQPVSTPSTAAQQAATDKLTVQVLPGVSFTGVTSDHSSTLTSPIGSLTTQGGAIFVQDAASHPVFGAPLAAKSLTPAAAQTAPVAQPVAASQGDFLGDLHTAYEASGAYTGLAAGVGATAGTLIGAAVGCPLGALTAGGLMVWTGPADIPSALIGCIAGAVITAGAGATVGSLAVGIPVAAAATMQHYNLIQAQRAAGTYNPAPAS